MDWGKNCELLDSFLSFHLNRKPLLIKIASVMESTAMAEGHYQQTMAILSQIECYLDDLIFSSDCDVVCGDITVGTLLKSVGITLRDDYPDPLGRLLNYMELVRCYERTKPFIFVNLRSYFPDDSVQRFLQTTIDHQYTLLLVDAWEHLHLPEERRLIIDKDLCDI